MTRVICIDLILGFLVCLPLVTLGDQDVQTRFEKSLQDAKSLINVEIELLDTLWMPQRLSANGAAFSRTFQYSYIASGLKYRARCKLISGTETNLAKLFESAYDGKSYSSYDDDNRYMTRRSNSPAGDRGQSPLNPLIAPFMFLTRHSDDCLECVLRFTDIVSGEWTNGLILPKGQGSNGLVEISMPGLRLREQPTLWQIAINEAGDSFTPKTISRVARGGGAQVVYRLLNYTNLGGYRFPTRIEWVSSSYPPTSPPTLLSTGTVTMISARIPDQRADSVFKLDSEEKSAGVVWDWDQRNFIKPARENPNRRIGGR